MVLCIQKVTIDKIVRSSFRRYKRVKIDQDREKVVSEVLHDYAMNNDHSTAGPTIPTCTRINYGCVVSTIVPICVCNVDASKSLVKDVVQYSTIMNVKDNVDKDVNDRINLAQ